MIVISKGLLFTVLSDSVITDKTLVKCKHIADVVELQIEYADLDLYFSTICKGLKHIDLHHFVETIQYSLMHVSYLKYCLDLLINYIFRLKQSSETGTNLLHKIHAYTGLSLYIFI